MSSNDELLAEIDGLKKENETLKEEAANALAQPAAPIANLAGLDESVTIKASYAVSGSGRRQCEFDVTWARIFQVLSPRILNGPTDHSLRQDMGKALISNGTYRYLELESLDRIRVQFMALGLIKCSQGDTEDGMAWSLTEKGHSLMLKVGSVKSQPTDDQ